MQVFLVWQLALSYWFLGKRYTPRQLAGCLLVLTGVVIVVARSAFLPRQLYCHVSVIASWQIPHPASWHVKRDRSSHSQSFFRFYFYPHPFPSQSHSSFLPLPVPIPLPTPISYHPNLFPFPPHPIPSHLIPFSPLSLQPLFPSSLSPPLPSSLPQTPIYHIHLH